MITLILAAESKMYSYIAIVSLDVRVYEVKVVTSAIRVSSVKKGTVYRRLLATVARWGPSGVVRILVQCRDGKDSMSADTC